MLIVKIIGGLGNQMFQYAYAKALQQKGYVVKIDISGFETYGLHQYGLDKYNIDLPSSTKAENDKFYKNTLFTKVLKRLGFDFSKKIIEKSLFFDDEFLKIKDNSYLDGYFQTEKYFYNIKEVILKQFDINQEVSNYTKEIKNQISNAKVSVSLHIRRGDYLTSVNSNIHGVCDLEYYREAVGFLDDKFEETQYFIFSDDIAWVKENLKMDNAVYIESKEKRIPHEDIYLMSSCNHNIIANSSFSWWGAWLNRNKDKIVIAPKRWFTNVSHNAQSQDIVCENWERI